MTKETAVEYVSQYGTTTKCYLEPHRYNNGNLAIAMVEAETGEPYATATVNTGVILPADTVAIKDYSENAGVLNFLVKQGVVEPPYTIIPKSVLCCGWVDIPVCKLTESGKELFAGV